MLSASSCRSFLRWKGSTTAVYLTTARRCRGLPSENKTGCPCQWALSSNWSAHGGLSFWIDYGERLASALAASPRRDAKNSPGKERLDLTHHDIDFGLDVRDRLYKAGIAAGVEVFMSRRDGPALVRR